MAPIRLSDTTAGRRWLENFPTAARPTARLLVDSVRFVSETEFRAKLIQLVESIKPQLSESLAVFPVRGAPANLDGIYREPDESRAYRDNAGSEAIVTNIARQVARQHARDHSILAYPTISQMRRWRMRTILFLDDYSGSGQKAIEHIHAWLQHPTVRSWRSYRLLQFAYAGFAVSTMAHRRINQEPAVRDRVFSVEHGHDFNSARWTVAERDRIVDLCQDFAKRRELALGWNNSGGLLVMGHTVPNNLPAILIQNRGPGDTEWRPLFSRYRGVPGQEQLEFSSVTLRTDLAQAASAFGQQKLATRLSESSDEIQDLVLTILAAIARTGRNPERVARESGVPYLEVVEGFKLARALGLVSPTSDHLTDDGYTELRYGRRPRRLNVEVPDNPEPYYPHSLRRG